MGHPQPLSNLYGRISEHQLNYKLEKSEFSTRDFEKMTWHDSSIVAIGFNSDEFELWLDLDYIFEWIKPAEDERGYRFWIAPCTLIFLNVYDLVFDVESVCGFSIDSIKRSNLGTPRNADFVGCNEEWTWEIECQEGTISFRSVGFKQLVRHQPRLRDKQRLSWDDRGGIGFK